MWVRVWDNQQFSYLRKNDKIWFDIKLEVGPFEDWEDYFGAMGGVYSNLQDTVLRCMEHPDLLEGMLREKYREGGDEDLLPPVWFPG